jgi:hypothetical protein
MKKKFLSGKKKKEMTKLCHYGADVRLVDDKAV